MFRSGRLWVGHVASMTRTINAYRNLVGKSVGNISLTPRWRNNIKFYLREIGCDVMNWIHLGQVKDNNTYKVSQPVRNILDS
jgi:hypothetical protein